MTDTELNERFDRVEKAIEKSDDGYGCGTLVLICLLLYIIHLLGGC